MTAGIKERLLSVVREYGLGSGHLALLSSGHQGQHNEQRAADLEDFSHFVDYEVSFFVHISLHWLADITENII